MAQVIIIGGGLAGLTASILLARKGVEVVLFERKRYPFHRVCGEYISNEVVDFLERERLLPDVPIAQVRRLILSSPSGNTLTMPLDMGGIGISRFTLDHYLYEQALRAGVVCHTGTQVKSFAFRDAHFEVQTTARLKPFRAPWLLAAYGKTSHLDRRLQRPFVRKKQGYIGVKYHVRTDFAADAIALHQFHHGYCGVSKVDGDRFNVCYLATKELVKQHGGIPEMEAAELQRNPWLKSLFANADFLLPERLVINQFGFYPKSTIEGHALMLGDTAGLVPPLAGNGMAMAFHSAKIAADLLAPRAQRHSPAERKWLENAYTWAWKRAFGRRLSVGRKLQAAFGHRLLGEMLVSTFRTLPQQAGRSLIRQTHGQSI